MGILEFFHQEWIYDDYYLDRRRVMKKTAHELLDKNMAFKHSSGAGISKIAILTTNMNHVDESVTRFVMDYANEIAGHNVEVAIFITEPFLVKLLLYRWQVHNRIQIHFDKNIKKYWRLK